MCWTFPSSAVGFLTLIVVLSNRALMSQDTSPSPPRANLLPDAPSALTSISEPKEIVRLTFGRFSFIPEQRQGLNKPSPSPNTSLMQDRRTIEWCGCNASLVGLSPPKRTIFAPFNDFMNRHTKPDSDELEH